MRVALVGAAGGVGGGGAVICVGAGAGAVRKPELKASNKANGFELVTTGWSTSEPVWLFTNGAMNISLAGAGGKSLYMSLELPTECKYTFVAVLSGITTGLYCC